MDKITIHTFLKTNSTLHSYEPTNRKIPISLEGERESSISSSWPGRFLFLSPRVRSWSLPTRPSTFVTLKADRLCAAPRRQYNSFSIRCASAYDRLVSCLSLRRVGRRNWLSVKSILERGRLVQMWLLFDWVRLLGDGKEDVYMKSWPGQ